MNPQDEFREIVELVDQIDGWLAHSEGKYLYSIAKDGPGEGAIVEIGSFKGKSTIWLAAGSGAGKREKVYTIDPHDGGPDLRERGDFWTLPELIQNLRKAKLLGGVVPLVATSEEMAREWDRPVRFLWIDGAHSYEMVTLDYAVWEPHLIEGGVVAVHDTTEWAGPKKFADTYLYKSNKFINVGFISTISYGTKKTNISLKDKIKNRYTLYIRYLYIWGRALARKTRLPQPMRMAGKKFLRVIIPSLRKSGRFWGPT